jgi:hypothetical protein
MSHWLPVELLGLYGSVSHCSDALFLYAQVLGGVPDDHRKLKGQSNGVPL